MKAIMKDTGQSIEIRECAEDFDSSTNDDNLIMVVPEENKEHTFDSDQYIHRNNNVEIVPDDVDIKANKGDYLAMDAGRTQMWVINKEVM